MNRERRSVGEIKQRVRRLAHSPTRRCAYSFCLSLLVGFGCTRPPEGDPGQATASAPTHTQPLTTAPAATAETLIEDAGASAILSARDPRLKEVAASEHQWTGIAVLPGPKLFVNFPRWGRPIPMSVARLDAQGAPQAFPDQRWNSWKSGDDPKRAFVCVQSVVAGPDGHLWVLDPASPEMKGVVQGGPKLLVFDPNTRALVRHFEFAAPVVTPQSYLNDVRILKDLSYAFMTDSGSGAIVVLDLHSGRSRRLLEQSPAVRSTGVSLRFPNGVWTRDGKRPDIHSDGIALSHDQQTLYFHALTGDSLHRIAVSALIDPKLSAEDVATRVENVARSAPVDGIETSPDGTLYLTGLESFSLRRLTAAGRIEEWLKDGRLIWPDSIAFDKDGTLYVTTSQIQYGNQPPGPYRVLSVKAAP